MNSPGRNLLRVGTFLIQSYAERTGRLLSWAFRLFSPIGQVLEHGISDIRGFMIWLHLPTGLTGIPRPRWFLFCGVSVHLDWVG